MPDVFNVQSKKVKNKEPVAAQVSPPALSRPVSPLVSVYVDVHDTFSRSRIWLWSFLVSLEMTGNGEKDEYIFRKKTKYLLKKEACMFSTVCTGIFMLPLLLMCQCCGRDLHSATHATLLWCRPRMYQHEIKPLVIFYRYSPEETV